MKPISAQARHPNELQVAANLRRIRKNADLSQAELAKRLREWWGLPVNQSAMSRLESGDRVLSFREAWACVAVCSATFSDLCWVSDTGKA